METKEMYELLPGKTDDKGNWLPVFVHLEDTASSIEYLAERRVPNSVVRACGLEREEFRKVCVFLAMVHDIGKGTPLFSAKRFVKEATTAPPSKALIQRRNFCVAQSTDKGYHKNTDRQNIQTNIFVGRGIPAAA